MTPSSRTASPIIPGRPAWSAKPVFGRPVAVAWGVLAPVLPPTGMVPRAIEVLAAAVLVWSAGRTVAVAWGVLAPVPPPTGIVPRAIEVLATSVLVWSAGRTVALAWGVLVPVPPPTGMVPRAIEVWAAAVMVWSAGRTVRADGMGVLVAVGIATTEVLVAPTCAVGTMGAAVGGMVAVGRIAASTVC